MSKMVVAPTRYSNAPSGAFPLRTAGLVKFRLAHATWGSVFVIDAIFVKRSPAGALWDYFLPSFYTAPMIGFGLSDGIDGQSEHAFNTSVDVSAPSAMRGLRIGLRVGSADKIASYADGAQLYRCEIGHDAPLAPHRGGEARQFGSRFELKVFHHTASATLPLIKKSGCFRGSPWNLQGTRQLMNVCYPYFTTLRRISSEHDLGRIAMACDGKVLLKGMAEPVDPQVEMIVYRSSTRDRTATMSVYVPAEVVAPNHLRIFRPGHEIPYYEVVSPEIVRIGLKPGKVLPFSGDTTRPVAADLQTFEYVICGDASSKAGLLAPFDEENTGQIFHFENLQSEDCFDFWRRNSNSDQISGRTPLFRALQP